MLSNRDDEIVKFGSSGKRTNRDKISHYTNSCGYETNTRNLEELHVGSSEVQLGIHDSVYS